MLRLYAGLCLCVWLSARPSVWVNAFALHHWILQSVCLCDYVDETYTHTHTPETEAHVWTASASQRRDNQGMLRQSVERRGGTEQSLHHHHLSPKTDTETHLCLHVHIRLGEEEGEEEERKQEESRKRETTIKISTSVKAKEVKLGWRKHVFAERGTKG